MFPQIYHTLPAMSSTSPAPFDPWASSTSPAPFGPWNATWNAVPIAYLKPEVQTAITSSIHARDKQDASLVSQDDVAVMGGLPQRDGKIVRGAPGPGFCGQLSPLIIHPPGQSPETTPTIPALTEYCSCVNSTLPHTACFYTPCVNSDYAFKTPEQIEEYIDASKECPPANYKVFNCDEVLEVGGNRNITAAVQVQNCGGTQPPPPKHPPIAEIVLVIALVFTALLLGLALRRRAPPSSARAEWEEPPELYGYPPATGWARP